MVLKDVTSDWSLAFLCLSAQEWTLEVRMEVHHLPLLHSSGRNHENPGIGLNVPLCEIKKKTGSLSKQDIFWDSGS